MSRPPERILVTVTGKDHPGITAKLTAVLMEVGASLHDIEQVVVHGNLNLAFVVSLPEQRGGLKELLFAAKELEVDLDFEPLSAGQTASRGLRYVVTAIGQELGAQQMHAVASVLAAHQGNIETISRLSSQRLSSVEIQVSLQGRDQADLLKQALLSLATRSGFDLALQREGLFRRSKRLVVMDMDSTLIRIEVIDELARAKGVVAEVAKITERAMQGELDFDESLRRRLALLKGLDVGVLERIASELPITEGAETLIRVIRRLGYRTAVISGGFSIAAEALKTKLGIDDAYSNTLEVREGKLTGNVVGPIINAQRKAELLENIAAEQGVLLDQTIAVGDGANDLLMLKKAGLGVAFRAKPKLRESADTSLSASGLDAILFLLGITEKELEEISNPQGR